MANTKKFTSASSQPLTIGFLSVEDIHHSQLQMLEGVLNIAQTQQVNVLCVPGQHLRSPAGFDMRANILYNLIGTDNLAGLIIWGSLLGQYITLAEFETFCQHYHPLPIVKVTGITEAVAETIVDLDIDWSGIKTLPDLQTGLMAALKNLGVRLQAG